MDDWTLFLVVKGAHILSAILLFGTGLGTAFHFWMANRSGDVAAIASAARSTVIADWLFTTPAAIAQPATGLALAVLSGRDLTETWLIHAYALYALAALCWLPVVGLQIRMARLSAEAQDEGAALPEEYQSLYRRWFLLGWPAFAAMLAILVLMMAKPGG